MINVTRQTKVRVRTALVGRNDDLTVLDLELHQRQTRLLVGFHSCFTQEQHIILAVLLFRIDRLDQCRQLLEIGRIGVVQPFTAIIPPEAGKRTEKDKRNCL